MLIQIFFSPWAPFFFFFFFFFCPLYISYCHVLLSLSLFFLGHMSSVWKFPGQGSNPCHSSSPSWCSNNVRSLTLCTTRELQHVLLFELFLSRGARDFVLACGSTPFSFSLFRGLLPSSHFLALCAFYRSPPPKDFLPQTSASHPMAST